MRKTAAVASITVLTFTLLLLFAVPAVFAQAGGRGGGGGGGHGGGRAGGFGGAGIGGGSRGGGFVGAEASSAEGVAGGFSAARHFITASTATPFSSALGQARSFQPGRGMTLTIIGVHPRPTMGIRTTITTVTPTTTTMAIHTGRTRASRQIRLTGLTARRLVIHIRAGMAHHR